MKKKLVTIATALALVVVMIATLCACSTYGSIKSAFEKEGYKEIEATEEQKEMVKDLAGEDYDSKVSFHVLQKEAGEGLLGGLDALNIAIIIEFKNNDDMVKALKENVSEEDLKAAYDEIQKLDTVNGNCTIISVSPDALKIFKNTK